MPDLVRGAANNVANPRVLFAWQAPNVGDTLETGVPPQKRQLKGGFFQPFENPLTFRILRPDGSELIPPTNIDPTDETNQLDPASDGGRGRLIVLPFTVPTTEPLGTYTAEVTFVAVPDDGPPIPSQTKTFPFRVLDEALPFVENSYLQIQDLLDAGFPIGDPAPCPGYSLTDSTRAIRRAVDFIETITERFFEPRYLVHDHDGKGGPIIQTKHVIIGLTNVTFTFTTFTPADLPIEEGDLRVYNRHIRQNLLQPDDRQDPRVEFLRTPIYRFPRSQLLGEIDILSSFIGFTDSQQNVKIRGMWGYTDYDGSPFGKTPDLIKEAAIRLAARYIQPLWKQVGGAGGSSGVAGPVLMEKTLDQQVRFSDVASSSNQGVGGAYTGAFTGDPEIDQLLALYMRPPTFGSA